MAISKTTLLSFITESVTRNPTMGIPALEDRLCKFVDFRLFILYICVWERKREGKREGKKGREKEREKGRERKKGRELRR